MEQDTSEVDVGLQLKLHAVNPWEQDSRAMVNIRNSLILADQMGLKALTPESHSKCTQMLSQLSSSKLIDIQKEITEKNKALSQVKLKIAYLSQEMPVSDFLQHDFVEKRMNMVNHLCTDLDLVLKNINVLVHRLQKPIIGDHIKIDAAYHKFTKEALTHLVPTLNDLTLHLDNITWASNHNFSSSQLEPLLMEVQGLTASMHTSYHMMSQVKNGLGILSSHPQQQSPTELDVSVESKHPLSSPPGGNSSVIQQRSSKANNGRVQY